MSTGNNGNGKRRRDKPHLYVVDIHSTNVVPSQWIAGTSHMPVLHTKRCKWDAEDCYRIDTAHDWARTKNRTRGQDNEPS